MKDIAAVVLAGGNGLRLGGVEKALVRIGNKTLLQLVCEAVEHQSGIILISTGQKRLVWRGYLTLPDLLPAAAGPLAGIAAAVHHLSTQPDEPKYLLSVAVDTPYFPHDFTARALEHIAGRDVVIAGFGEQLYPTNALWRFQALKSLPAMHLAGSAARSPRGLAGQMKSSNLDWAGLAEKNPFANINTLADLLAAGLRAKG